MEDSIEAESKLFSEAEVLAEERGMPSPTRSSYFNSPGHDQLNISASSMNSTTIEAALASSQQMGGQPVVVSLPTKTPQKVLSAEKTADLYNSQKLGSGKSSSQINKMSSTMPFQTQGPGLNTPNTSSKLHHTSPAPIAMVSKGVTINEKENTISSPNPALSPTHSPARSPQNLIPALKDAGVASAALDDVNMLVRQARLQASPRNKEESMTSQIQVKKQSEPIVDASSTTNHLAKARAKAAYLMHHSKGERHNIDGDSHQEDKASSNGSTIASGRSYKTSTSDIAKRLSASQEGGWTKNVTSQISNVQGGNSFNAAQEALFLNMKQIHKTLQRNSKSSDAKSTGSSMSARDDSDDDRTRVSRPSTAGSTRSSGRGSNAGSDAKRSSRGIIPLKKSTADLRDISNRLTQPVKIEYTADEKKKDPTLAFMLLDEAKECGMHKPFKAKRWAESTRAATSDSDAKESSGFTDRMEGQERVRRQAMEDRINQLDYEARLDRKECPNCHAKQSYNEVKMKILKCSICSEEFQPRLTWAQVRNGFFERSKEYEQNFKSNYEKLLQQITEEHAPKIHKYNPKTGKVESVIAPEKATRWDTNAAEQFFSRMEQKLQLRDERLLSVEKATVGAVCTFQPHIVRHKKGDDDEDEGGENGEGKEGAADRAQAFMMRLETDMEERKKMYPEKFLQKKLNKGETKKPIWN